MEVAYRTSIGKQRNDNEDYVDVYTNQAGQHLAIIADGIGGHQGGWRVLWRCPTWVMSLNRQT